MAAKRIKRLEAEHDENGRGEKLKERAVRAQEVRLVALRHHVLQPDADQ